MNHSASLVRYAWLSVAAAVATITLKTVAWLVTDSVGLLSDAMESLVNLAAAPPDAEHPYGRFKAEYVSSGIEGALIVFAAISIVYSALPRLATPQAIDAPLLGLALSAAATAINLAVALVLISVGKREHS